MNTRKASAINAEIEKLLKEGFIYPVPLTEWVSNLVPVAKKQGAIRICTDFHDLNHACPKDILIKFWMSVQAARFFPLWMAFPNIIIYKLNLRTNIRLHLLVLGKHLHVEKFLSALKTLELHFNRQ